MAAGDDPLAHLYAQHYESLLRFGYLLTGGRGAEDLVQDALLRSLTRWDRRAAPETLGPWLRTTMLRLHLNRLRGARREIAALARFGPEKLVETEVADPAVVRALRRLPPRQRAAIVLRYYEDLSEQQVADRLSCKLGTAKALLHQGRTRLSALLGNQGGQA